MKILIKEERKTTFKDILLGDIFACDRPSKNELYVKMELEIHLFRGAVNAVSIRSGKTCFMDDSLVCKKVEKIDVELV